MSFEGMADRALGVLTRVFRKSDNSTGVGLTFYNPHGAASYPIDGIFDDQHAYSEPGTGVKISSINPTLGVRGSQLRAAPKKLDTITVAGVLYHIVEAKPDGIAGWVFDLVLP